jgi:hypothetical protein
MSSSAPFDPHTGAALGLLGYRYLECEAQTALVEVWRAQGPDGQIKTIKIISGLARKRILTPKELEQASHLRFVKHPRLIPLEAVEADQGRLILVSPWAQSSVRARYRDCLAQGLPGIPRDELLEYLRYAAEGLDYLDRQEGLHHLSLSPASLVFVQGELQLADYGLVELAWLPAGQPLDQTSLRYASPEAFDNQYTTTSDQYSVALVFCEMLTGRLPFHGNMPKQMRENRLNGQPDLQLMPAYDAEALRQALARDPAARFPSCTALVEALVSATPRRDKKRAERQTVSDEETPATQEAQESAAQLTIPLPGDVDRLVNQLVQLAAYSTVVREQGGIRYQMDEKGALVHKCAAWLPPGMAVHKLQGFAHQWQASLVSDHADVLVYQIDLPRSLWQRFLIGAREFLQVQVELFTQRGSDARLTEVLIQVTYHGRHEKEGRDAVQRLGPALLYSIRTYLLATAEHRIQERFAFDYPLWITPVYQGHVGDPLGCHGKDISLQGIGFLSPVKVPTQDVQIQVHTPELGRLMIPATILRTQLLPDGHYEIGARFAVAPTSALHPL